MVDLKAEVFAVWEEKKAGVKEVERKARAKAADYFGSVYKTKWKGTKERKGKCTTHFIFTLIPTTNFLFLVSHTNLDKP